MFMSAQAALRAALQGLELYGREEREPPAGSMTTRLMRHQRLALDWMLRREAGSVAPRGGILADDQVKLLTCLATRVIKLLISSFTDLNGHTS